MTDIRTFDKRTVVGLLVGLIGLGIYLRFVGVDAIVGSLRTVSTRRAASLVIVGFVSLFLWGTGLWLVLRQMDAKITLWRAILLFDATGFINSVTPFGQAGGDPVSGLLASRVAPMEYETGFAAIVSLNAINRLASVLLGLVGAGYLLTRVAFSVAIRNAALVGAGIVVVVGVGGVFLWQYRDTVIKWTTRLLDAVLARLWWVPRFEPPERAAIRQRLRRFIAAIEQLGTNRRRLVLVVCLGIAGQLSVGATLWVALRALGADVPLALVLVIIPVAKLSGIAPTLGGLGSASAFLTGLLVTLTAINTTVATAAALLYRAAAFWTPMITGGLALLFLLATPVESATSRLGRGDGSDTRVAFAIAGGVATLLLVVVHLRNVLIEPYSPIVHLLRDGGVAAMGFGALWMGFRLFARHRSNLGDRRK